MSYAEQRMLHGRTQFNPPSRFLRELPPELVEEVRPKVKTYSTGFGGSNTFRSPATAPKPMTRTTNFNETGYRVGQRVRHAKFGDGVITDSERSLSMVKLVRSQSHEAPSFLSCSRIMPPCL